MKNFLIWWMIFLNSLQEDLCTFKVASSTERRKEVTLGSESVCSFMLFKSVMVFLFSKQFWKSLLWLNHKHHHRNRHVKKRITRLGERLCKCSSIQNTLWYFLFVLLCSAYADMFLWLSRSWAKKCYNRRHTLSAK